MKVDYKRILKDWVLPILFVPLVGFLLLLGAFVADALFQSGVRLLMGASGDPGAWFGWLGFNPLHLFFALLVLLVSWPIFKGKRVPLLLKATWLVVPLATSLITVFISGFGRIGYGGVVLDVLLGLGLLIGLVRGKAPWVYWYATGLVYLSLIAVMVMGIEI